MHTGVIKYHKYHIASRERSQTNALAYAYIQMSIAVFWYAVALTFVCDRTNASTATDLLYVNAFCAIDTALCSFTPSAYCVDADALKFFTCSPTTGEMSEHRFDMSGFTAPVTVPTELALLTQIDQLDFLTDIGTLAVFPSTIASLTLLTKLSFNGFSTTVFPVDAPNLQELGVFNAGVGSLPSQMGLLSDLTTFRVGASSLGPLPEELDCLESLKTLEISASSIGSGPLPEFGRKANIERYILQGVDDLTEFNDPNLFQSPDLVEFTVSGVPGMTGVLPQTLGLASSLVSFQLIDTDLSGELPDTLSLLTNLEQFVISSVPISGTLSSNIRSWSNLKYLSIFESDISGTLPDVFDNLSQLTELRIGNFALSPMPACEDPLAADTNFFGPLPASLFESLFASTNAYTVQIQNTCFNGSLPEVNGCIADIGASDSSLVISQTLIGGVPPAWLGESLVKADLAGLAIREGACDLSANRFCFKPSPATSVQAFDRCALSLDGVLDDCGVCEGDGSTCRDCTGALFGDASVDACGQCGGTNACLDCAGVVGGDSVYDACDVCDGDSLSCQDCEGTQGGSAQIDVCGVCSGDGSSCVDCSGTPNGSSTLDVCGVCNGDGECVDCAGVNGGTRSIDECGDCVDKSMASYRPSCYDCLGIANGTTVRDLCGNCPASWRECDIASLPVRAVLRTWDEWLCIGSAILATIGALFAIALCMASYRSRKCK